MIEVTDVDMINDNAEALELDARRRSSKISASSSPFKKNKAHKPTQQVAPFINPDKTATTNATTTATSQAKPSYLNQTKSSVMKKQEKVTMPLPNQMDKIDEKSQSYYDH